MPGGGLFLTVHKASNRSVTVRRSRGQSGTSSVFPWRACEGIYRYLRGSFCDCVAVRCQLYSSGGFIKVVDARGAVRGS
jgi:hypothetical protein